MMNFVRFLLKKKHFSKIFSFFRGTQEALWYSSGGQWQGIARADIFFTQNGRIAIAELNSDTPSGLDEAYLLSQYAEELTPGYINPNRDLPKIFTSIITRAIKVVQRSFHWSQQWALFIQLIFQRTWHITFSLSTLASTSRISCRSRISLEYTK